MAQYGLDGWRDSLPVDGAGTGGNERHCAGHPQSNCDCTTNSYMTLAPFVEKAFQISSIYCMALRGAVSNLEETA